MSWPSKGGAGVTEAALAAIDAWDPTPITASTHTAVAGQSRVYTHATGCDVTLPAGAANGMMIAVRAGHASGYVKFVTGGGSSKVQTGTTQIIGLGRTMVAQATENANEWNITGHDDGPRYLGTFTWDELIAAFPVNGAAVGALVSGDWAWCSTFGCKFVPNIAKTRMRPDGCFLRLPQVSVGSVATPLGTTTSLSNVKWALTAPQIPAYLLGVGDKLRAFMTTDKTGANATSENKIYLSTADDLTGANLINIASGAPANDFRIAVELDIVSTTVGVATRSMQINSAGTGNPTDVTINNTVLQYLTCSTQMYSTSDSVKLLSFSGAIEFAP